MGRVHRVKGLVDDTLDARKWLEKSKCLDELDVVLACVAMATANATAHVGERKPPRTLTSFQHPAKRSSAEAVRKDS